LIQSIISGLIHGPEYLSNATEHARFRHAWALLWSTPLHLKRFAILCFCVLDYNSGDADIRKKNQHTQLYVQLQILTA
jgi:hypothetical protein